MLRLGDEPAAWSALGFAVEDGRMDLGGLALELTGEGAGVRALEVERLGVERPAGLPIVAARGGGADPTRAPAHPIGATAVDHVVVLTGEIDCTVAALAGAGLDLRRRREPPEAGVRQAFFNLATTILEVGETAGAPRFWGLTVVVEDIEAAAERLGALLGTPREAVQPGRRIATLRPEAGLGLAVALITPRVRTRRDPRQPPGRPVPSSDR